MPRLRTLLGLLPFLLAACAGNDAGGSADATGDTSGSGDVALEAEGAEASYPAGPYGTVAGETIAPLEFYDPKTEETISIAQWYQHPKIKLLMLVSTAAW